MKKLAYFSKEALTGIFRSGLMSLASVTTISCCLILFGLFLLININIVHISEEIESKYMLEAYLKVDASPEEINAIGEQIKKIDGVAEILPITKEEALSNLKNRLGDDAVVFDGVESDFLSFCYNVTLSSIEKSAEITDKIQRISGVDSVTNKQDLVNRITAVTKFLRSFSFWSMIALFFVSMFIVVNIIKVTVFARRREINIMKFVGATDSFIRMPFVIEGVFIGLVSSVIAFFLLEYGYVFIASSIDSQIISLAGFGDTANILAICFLVLGVFIGAVGSGFSIKKHLQV